MNLNRFAVRNIARWLFVLIALTCLPAASYAQVAVGISVRIGPPALPVYAQPICPGPGYMWTPGYWAWNDDDGYYWVPGTWVVAPVGLLWTPGYWGWGGGFYVWHVGYWGPHVGFYGGINYGFGYGGFGFVGGEWRSGAFYYNRSVTNVSVTNVTNVYNKTVIVNENHTSFNGGEGGVKAQPRPEELAAEREHHTAALSAQTQHEHAASQNRANFASENHGRPAVAATSKPGDFSSRSAVSARSAGGEYHAPAMSPKQARATPAAGSNGHAPSAAGKGNEGFRPFTPPSKSNSSTPAAGNRSFNPPSNHSTPGNASHTQSMPRGESAHSAPAPSHSAPPVHSAPAPSHSAPPVHTAPAPRNESKPARSSSPPPKQDHHRGR